MAERVEIVVEGKDNLSAPLGKARAALDRLTGSSSGAKLGIQGVSSAASASHGPIGGMGNILQGAMSVAAGFGIFNVLSGAIDGVKGAIFGFNASMEQNKIAFETMLGGADKADKMLKDLYDFASKTPFEFPDLVRGTKRMLAFGFASEDIIPMMTSIGDAVAGLGGSAFEIDRVTRALGQMKAKGKVSAEEMMQMAELGIPAWDMLAKGMGKSTAEVMKLSEKGLIPANKAIKVLVDGMEERFPNMMKKQSASFQGMMSTLKDTVVGGLAKAGESIFNFSKAGLKNLLDFLTNPALGDALGSLGQALGSVFNKDAKGWLTNIDNVRVKLKEMTGVDFGPFLGSVGRMAAALRSLGEGALPLARALMPVLAIIGSRLWASFTAALSLLGAAMGGLAKIVSPLTAGFTTMGAGIGGATAPFRVFAEALAKGLEVWLAWQAVSKVVKLTQNIIHTGQKLITNIGNLVGTVRQTVSVIGSLITKVADIASTITQKVVRTGAALITEAKDIVQKIKIETDVPTDFFKGLATGFGSALAGALVAVNAGAILGAIGTAIAAAAAAIGGVISAPVLLIGAAIVAGIVGAIAVWQNWDAVKSFFGEWGGKVGDWLGPFFGAIGEWLGKLPGVAVQALGGLRDAIAFVAGVAFGALEIAASAAWTWLSTEIPTWPGRIGEFLGGLAGEVGKALEAFSLEFPKWVTSTWGWLSTEIPTWPGRIGAFLGGLAGQMGEVFGQAWTAVTGKLGELWAWIATEVPTWPERFVAFLTSLPENVGIIFGDVLTAISGKLSEIWENAKGWAGMIASAIMGPLGGLVDWVKNLWADIGRAFQEGQDWIKRMWGVGSPAKEAIRIGESIRQGFEIGLSPRSIGLSPRLALAPRLGLPSLRQTIRLVREALPRLPDMSINLRPRLAAFPRQMEAISPNNRLAPAYAGNGSMTMNVSTVNVYGVQNVAQFQEELRRQGRAAVIRSRTPGR